MSTQLAAPELLSRVTILADSDAGTVRKLAEEIDSGATDLTEQRRSLTRSSPTEDEWKGLPRNAFDQTVDRYQRSVDSSAISAHRGARLLKEYAQFLLEAATRASSLLRRWQCESSRYNELRARAHFTPGLQPEVWTAKWRCDVTLSRMKNLVAQADRAAAQLALELTALEAGFEQPLTLSDIASAPARLWSGVGLGAVGGAVDSLRGLKSLTVDGMSLDPEERRDFRRSWGQIGRLVGIGASPTEVAEAWGQALGAMTGFSGVKAGIQAGDADLVTRSLGEAFASDALTGLGVRGLTSMTGTFLDQVVTGGRRVSGDLWTPRPLRGVAEVEGSSLATADGLLEIIDKNDPILDTIWGRGPSDPQHFAVATHPESFDLARITPEPVFREGDGVLWRLDRREPWTGQTLPDVFPPPSLSDMRAGKAVWGPDTPEEFLAAVEELHRTALAQDGPHRGIWQRGFEPRSLSLDPSHPSNLSLAQSVGDWDQFLNDSHDVIKSSIRQEANGSPFAISTSYGQGIRNWHAHLEADLEVPTFLYKINGAPGGIDVELTWAKARRMSMDEIDWIAHEEALLGEIARRPGSFTPDRIEELIERSRQSRVLKYEQEVLFFGGINPRYIEGAFLYRGVDPDGILSGGQVRGRYLGWFPNPNYRP